MAKTIAMGLRPDLDTEANVVVMRVMDNGELIDSRRFQAGVLPREIAKRLLLAGISTVLQQRTSSIKEDPLAKLEAMQPVWERWLEGKWEAERTRGPVQVPVEVEALANAKGCSVARAQAAWRKFDEEQRKRVRERLADEIENLRAERETDVDFSEFAD